MHLVRTACSHMNLQLQYMEYLLLSLGVSDELAGVNLIML